MYAVKLSNEIYHLLPRSRPQDTLCGLSVKRVTSARGDELQPVEELESQERVCKHCSRINEQEVVK